MSTREGTYAFYVSSADPDDTPEWVDLTDRVREDEEPMVAMTGRQNDLDEADAGRFQAQLDNDNDDFTFGNDSSPYAAWWGPGRKCQLRETVAGTELNMWTGYLETPTEAIETAQVTDDEDQLTRDRKRVSITAVDRMGRLDSAEPFISTLGAHVVGSARAGSLVGYWPLLDANRPFRATVGSHQLTTVISGSPPGFDQDMRIGYQEGSRIPADDVSTALFVPGMTGGVISTAFIPLAYVQYLTGEILLSAGQTATLVAWANRDPAWPWNTTGEAGLMALSAYDLAGGHSLSASASRPFSASGASFKISAGGDLSGSTSSAAGTNEATARFYAIAIRLGYGPNVVEMWVDDTTYTVSAAGSPAGTFDGLDVSFYPVGSTAHLQLYVGDPSDFTHTDFIAQRTVGLLGLERQTTGERIRTIARYAGVPETELLIDSGTAIMQAASLAGKSPLTAMREAEAVERGLLYVDGSGRLVFKDRRTLYNV